MKKGRLIVISGPSGVGKGTVVKARMERDPQVKLSVSPRPAPFVPMKWTESTTISFLTKNLRK